MALWLVGATAAIALASHHVRAGEAAASARAAKGIEYKNDRITSVPWSIHIVEVARNDPTLEVRSMLARGTVLGLSRVSEQILAIPVEAGTPLAGINGDFYELGNSRYAGDPRGLQIIDGDLVSDPSGIPSYCAFWIDADGTPHITNVLSEFKVTLPDGQIFPFDLNEERPTAGAVLYTPTLGRATRTSGGRELILENPGNGSWIPFRVGETYPAKVREISDSGNTKLEKDVVVLSFGPLLAAKLPAIEIGATLKLSTATVPDLRGARTAIGGGSIVIPAGQLPFGGEHWWRPVLVHKDRLYTAIGCSGNIDDETDTERLKIWSYALDGTDKKYFCGGLRNTEKLLIQPGTDNIWGMDHGSDNFGEVMEKNDPKGRKPVTDWNPACEMNHYMQNAFYGHPYVTGNHLPRYEYMNRSDIIDWTAKTIPPAWSTGAHYAPNGMVFYDANQFPNAKGNAFVAYHGSWNRSVKGGYSVTQVLFENGRPYGEQVYVKFTNGDDIFGRPSDVEVAPDGSLLITDDWGNKIYRLTYVGK